MKLSRLVIFLHLSSCLFNFPIPHLPIHPIHELIIAKLELRWPRMDLGVAARRCVKRNGSNEKVRKTNEKGRKVVFHRCIDSINADTWPWIFII